MTKAASAPHPKGDVWTFDDFAPGQAPQQITVPLDADRINAWESIFGPLTPNSPLPRGMIVSALVEGFIKSGQPRPAGNIHAQQTLHFTGQAPRPGEVMTVSARVKSKDIRRSRKWITFQLDASIDGAALCSGDFTVIWAQ